jgi:hypothetical protein
VNVAGFWYHEAVARALRVLERPINTVQTREIEQWIFSGKDPRSSKFPGPRQIPLYMPFSLRHLTEYFPASLAYDRNLIALKCGEGDEVECYKLLSQAFLKAAFMLGRWISTPEYQHWHVELTKAVLLDKLDLRDQRTFQDFGLSGTRMMEFNIALAYFMPEAAYSKVVKMKFEEKEKMITAITRIAKAVTPILLPKGPKVVPVNPCLQPFGAKVPGFDLL